MAPANGLANGLRWLLLLVCSDQSGGLRWRQRFVVTNLLALYAAFNAGWTWLVVVASITAVISVGYYFKILRAMYFKAPASEESISVNLSTRLILGATSFVTLFLGLAPQMGFTNADKLANRPAVEQPAAAVETIPAPASAPTPAVNP